MLKKAVQKSAEATGDLTSNEIADRITDNSQNLLNRIIQKQLQMNTAEKYLRKDVYLQKKDRILFLI